MKKLKRLYWAARSRSHQYRLAVVNGAREAGTSMLSSAVRVAKARLRYGAEPLHYSLFRFASIPESQWPEYVFDGPEFKRYLRSLSGSEPVPLTTDKALFHLHCIENGLPGIPVVCAIGDVRESSGIGVPRVDTVEDWISVLDAAPSELFIKPVGGSHGDGAFTVSRAGNGYEFEGRRGSSEEAYLYLTSILQEHRAWLVQPRMRPIPTLKPISSAHGLPTVRAVTVMRDGTPQLLIADLKIPVGKNIVDNFSGGSTGNLVAPIDCESGRLGAAWGSNDAEWPLMSVIDHHPDTGSPIEGFELPFWTDLVSLVLRAQRTVPQARSIGWDVAATDRGLMLVEANGAYDVSLLQVAHQRGLRRELQAALEA